MFVVVKLILDSSLASLFDFCVGLFCGIRLIE